ncbi:MAG: HNH endonuclease [Pirellulaceae bacterium]
MTLRRQVASRAGYRCEYCRLSEHYTSVPFQMDHVIAEKHEGETSLENLAFACLHCNAFKGPNIAGMDPVTKRIVRLFDPRRDSWDENFDWEGAVLKAHTAIGRATIAVLRINLPYRVAVRASHIQERLF